MKRIKKTKIIATLGPATSSVESIESLIKEGVDVLRINFSHSTHKEAEKMIAYEANLIFENHIAKGQLNHIIHFRQHIQEAQNQAINKALRQLDQGMSPEAVVVDSIRKLTNVFLHKPTTQLKQAILDKEENILKASKYLFETDDVT